MVNRAIRALRRSEVGRIHLLVLPGGGLGRVLASRLEQAFHDRLTEIDPLPYLEHVSNTVRKDLVRFVSEWPDRVLAGCSFKARFAREGLSLWWLTALAEKNNEDRPTFDLLCDIELVRLILDKESVTPLDQAFIVTDSTDFYAVCRRLFLSRGVRVLGLRPSCVIDPEGIPALLARRLRRFVSWSARVAAARWWSGRRREIPRTPPAVAFYTWYPSQWVRQGCVSLDRYYVDLPDYLTTRYGLPVVYAASGQGVPFRQHLQVLRESARGTVEPHHIEWLEPYLRFSDVARAYWGSLAPLRYLWLEMMNQEFRDSFSWDGLSRFELLRRDLRVSFLERIPDYLLLAKQIESFAWVRRPRVLVTYLELYCHGRAVIYGAKRGYQDVITVGYQHSAITRNKLFYSFEPHELVKAGASHPDFVTNLPTPDRFAITGSFGRRVLAAGGYPPEKLWVIGSPRFDGLREGGGRSVAAVKRRRELGIEPDRFVVLITGNIFRDSTRHLLEQSLLALRAKPECFALFKLHPFNRIDATAWIRRLTETYRYKSYTITELDVHFLLEVSAVLISTNSTTAAEAVAARVPVINLRAGYLDLSPLVEGGEVAWEAQNHEEISAALDEIIRRSGRFGRIMANREAFIEGMFFRLDGAARERFASQILQELTT